VIERSLEHGEYAAESVVSFKRLLQLTIEMLYNWKRLVTMK